MMRREKKQKKWLKHDFALAQAFQILEDEKCPKCGVAAWHAFSENSEIEFELEHTDCYSCAEKDAAEAKEKKTVHGRTTHVKAKHFEGGKLPGRAEFFEELMRKAEREEAKKQKK